jgi:glycosyltransferase involved in cell wall biosynthesis
VKAVIIIPALNEAKIIGSVLSSLPQSLMGVAKLEILVVDDGSSDDTFAIAKASGVNVVRHLANRGLGAAIKTGLEWAKTQNADIAITFDSDGQHDASDIPALIDPLVKKKADLVIGSRFIKKQGVPLDRAILNWFANLVTFLLSGTFCTDSQSGLRAFSKRAIALIDFKADRMEFSSEILLEAKRNNLKIKEIPIRAIYTHYSRGKGQKNLNAIPVFIRFLIRFLR